MTAERHLNLAELTLRPSGEWKPEPSGWTVVRIVEGVGYCLQAGAAQELSPHHVFMCGPNSRVVIRASQLGVLKLEFFLVQPQFLNGLLTVGEWCQLENLSSRATPCVLHFAPAAPVAQKFLRLAAQSARDGLSVRSALLQLWASAINGLLPAPVTASSEANLRGRLREFVGGMAEAELASRSLSELAEQLHCSERHFSRLFREEFKVSLRTWQTGQRLQRASQLLAASDTKIAHVAKEAGYRHLGLFNAMFKRQFGMTPSAWRQKAGLTVVAGVLYFLGLLAEAAEAVLLQAGELMCS